MVFPKIRKLELLVLMQNMNVRLNLNAVIAEPNKLNQTTEEKQIWAEVDVSGFVCKLLNYGNPVSDCLVF